MSHDQPKRPQPEESLPHMDPVKYGDIFKLSGDLASKPITQHDASAMTASEARVFGQPQTGSPAELMQAAAAINVAAGIDVAENQGVTVSETTAAGRRIITEAVGGQALGRRVMPEVPVVATGFGSAAIDGDPITIGETLEAVAISVGDKPVDQNDAAAISAAEIRATGENFVRPSGIGATAQSAATLNSRVTRREDMTKISDILSDATEKLPVDKAVTKDDADAVYAAEVQFPLRRDAAAMISEPGGVAASMATAAKLNDNEET